MPLHWLKNQVIFLMFLYLVQKKVREKSHTQTEAPVHQNTPIYNQYDEIEEF